MARHADGRIPVIQQQRLLDMGAWLDVNGEAIYGTRKWEGSSTSEQENVYFTKKGKDLFVICTKFPEKPIVINGISKTGKAMMLGVEGSVKAKKSGSRLTIEIPTITPVNNPSEYAWVFKIENAL